MSDHASSSPAAGAPVVFGITHVDLPVRALDAARRLYAGTLGFVQQAEGTGWLDLDAGGTVTLRLLEVRVPEHRATLRVRVASVEQAEAALLQAGCTRVHAPLRTPARELAAELRDPDGHTLIAWRALTEDEYDEEPALPTEAAWAPDAEALLKQLLRQVPALFRALARRKVVRVVESLAAGRARVTREEVIRGYILASPRITRGRNRRPLIEAGVDVDRYQADWDAD